MNIFSTLKTFIASDAGRATSFSVVALLGITGGALLYSRVTQSTEASGGAMGLARPIDNEQQPPVERAETVGSHSTEHVTIHRNETQSIRLETAPAYRANWPECLRVTGRLEVNRSRIAHMSPLVDGVVREVLVELGQTVKQGEVLAYIDSRQVGEAKLQLVKDQLQLSSAERNSKWYRTIHENTAALLDALRKGQTLDEIETAFQNRPLGTYWEQLVSALARLKRTKADFERIRGLGKSAVIPAKEIIRSRAEQEAAGAKYRALVEQIRFESQRQALSAQQELREAEAAVAISRTQLLILGYKEQEIESMDPIAEAERAAYYPVRSPLDGTVIARDAPLAKHVDDETELFHIADLTTLWLRADVFENDLDATLDLRGKSITFEASSYPGRQFTAVVFSPGNLVDDKSRAARTLAFVDNSEGLLKPGMFARVELTPRKDANVLQLPNAAIQRHDGATFVFVCDEDGGFQRRDVQLGRSTSQIVEIVAGLTDGELVANKGGFALKSEMLSELMVEE